LNMVGRMTMTPDTTGNPRLMTMKLPAVQCAYARSEFEWNRSQRMDAGQAGGRRRVLRRLVHNLRRNQFARLGAGAGDLLFSTVRSFSRCDSAVDGAGLPFRRSSAAAPAVLRLPAMAGSSVRFDVLHNCSRACFRRVLVVAGVHGATGF